MDEDNEEDANSQQSNEEEAAAAHDDDDSVEVVEVVVPTVHVYSTNPHSVARRERRLRAIAEKKQKLKQWQKKK